MTMAPLDAATTAALAERLAFVCDAVAPRPSAPAASAALAARTTRRSPLPRRRCCAARSSPAEAAPAAGEDAVASFRVRDARGDGRAPSSAWSPTRVRSRCSRSRSTTRRGSWPPTRRPPPGAGARRAGRPRRAAPGDVLGREDDGRLWIVAADLGAPGARALAERLADAVAAVPPLRGAPLTVSIGLAASPADGTDRDALTARADESLYAARAAGVPIA